MIIWLVFAIIILSFILLIILWIRGDFTPKPQTAITSAEIEEFLKEVTEKIGWSPPEAVPGGTRNQCGLYTFPATESGGMVTLGMPTLDSDTLESMTPTKVPMCIDPNQIVARQVQRICIGDGDKNFQCLDDAGNLFQIGQTIMFFEQCQIDFCPGEFGLIAINYAVANDKLSPDTRCLTLGSGTDVISLADCDVTKTEQYFQIERRDEKGAIKSNGDFASIKHRDTKNCVYPASVLSGDTSNVDRSIKVASCGSADALVWLLLPPKGVTIEGAQTVIPQQIGFTERLFKLDQTSLEEYLFRGGLTMFPDISKNSVILQAAQLKNDTPEGKLAITQIIDYKLFGDLTSWPTTENGINIPFNTWSFV